MNALQPCRRQFSHIKKLCSRLSSSEVQFQTEIGRFAFLSPFVGPYTTYMFIVGSLEVRSGLSNPISVN